MSDSAQPKQARATINDAPFTALLGISVESAADGSARVRLPYNLKVLNAGGPTAPIHGGAIASLVDTAACAAVWTLSQTRRSATVSLSVNFTDVAVESDLLADAKVRRSGKQLASINVEVRDDNGRLIADAIVTYKIA